jgi:hypothetical protein
MGYVIILSDRKLLIPRYGNRTESTTQIQGFPMYFTRGKSHNELNIALIVFTSTLGAMSISKSLKWSLKASSEPPEPQT